MIHKTVLKVEGQKDIQIYQLTAFGITPIPPYRSYLL
jgi:hypothetical protein